MGFARLILPISCFVLGAGSAVAVFAVRQSREPLQVGAGSVVEQTAYFAKPGLADKVYEHRLHASEVRQKIGLPAGRVFRRVGGTGELADVVWQLEYADQHALDHDLAVRAQSREFEEVRATMGTLIDKFSRGFYRPAVR
jgi:hypothetical protein